MLSPLKGNTVKNSKSTQINLNQLSANLSEKNLRISTLQRSFIMKVAIFFSHQILYQKKFSVNDILQTKEQFKYSNSGLETQENSQRQGGQSTIKSFKTRRTVSQKISCLSLSPTQWDTRNTEKQNDSMFSFLNYCNKNKMNELVNKNQKNKLKQISLKETSSTKLFPLPEYKQKIIKNDKCSNAEYQYKYFKITLPSKKFKAVHLLDDIESHELKPQYQIKNHFNRNENSMKVNESIEWNSWNKQTFILKKDHILDFKHMNQLKIIQENIESQKQDDQFEQIIESLKKKQNLVSVESERIKRISLYNKANIAITTRYEGFYKNILQNAKALEPTSQD